MKNPFRQFVLALKAMRRRMRRQYVRELNAACEECIKDDRLCIHRGNFHPRLVLKDLRSMPMPNGSAIVGPGPAIKYHNRKIPTVDFYYTNIFPNA